MVFALNAERILIPGLVVVKNEREELWLYQKEDILRPAAEKEGLSGK